MNNLTQPSPYGFVSGDLTITSLSSLCDPNCGVQTGPFGSQLHNEDYVEEGTPIITVEHLGDNRILHSNTPKVSDFDKNRLIKYTLQEGDVVFSRVGSVDRRALVRKDEDGWLFSGRCLRIRPNPAKADGEFLSYFFGLPTFQEHIRSIAVGATMPSLNTKILSDVAVIVPSTVVTQKRIARILGSLDDKIELNRRMSATLEDMARAIFKSWFIDFDPVHAKAKGCPTGLPAEIDALFPDSFQDSEFGDIPAGWNVLKLGSAIETIKGRSYKSSELQDSDTALVTLKSFARGGGYRRDGLKAFTGTYRPEQIIESGDVVVACTDVTQAAEIIGRTAIVRGNQGYATLVASLDTLIIRPKKELITKPFIYFLGRTEQFINHTYAHISGTTVLHLSKDAVSSFTYASPDFPLIEFFSEYASKVLQFQHLLEESSDNLVQIRDSLLPKLITGKIDLKKGAFNGNT